MRIKTIRKISYFEAKKQQYELSFEPRYSKIVQSATAKPQTRTCGTQYDPLDFKQDTKSSSKSTSSSVLKPQTSETDTKSNQTKNLVDRNQLTDLVHALDHQIKVRKVNQIKKKKTNNQTDRRKGHKILLSWQIDMRI